MTNKATLPPTQYIKLLNTIIEKAKVNLKNHSQLLPVAFLLNSATNKTEILGLPFKDENEKDYQAEIIKQRASKMQADAVCFLSEAWTIPKKYRTKEMVESILQKYGEVAKFPERVEIVSIHLETYEGIWTGLAEIKPAKKGRKMGGVQWNRTDMAEGRFVHLLPVKYATPDDVKNFIVKFRQKFKEAGIDPDQIMDKRTPVEIVESMARQSPADALTEDMINYLIEKLKGGTEG